MGAAAKGFNNGNGKIYGIIPSFFKENDIEPIYDKCNRLIYTKTMAERKTLMETMADAFIIVPGGVGTMEEFFEVLTLKQIKKHKKPIIIYNIDEYYNNILSYIYNDVIGKGFSSQKLQEMFLVTDDDEKIMEELQNFKIENLKRKI